MTDKTERILYGIWFGLLGFLLPYMLQTTPHPFTGTFIVSCVTAVCTFILSYQFSSSHLHRVDYISLPIVKISATSWFGCLGCLIASVIIKKVDPGLAPTLKKDIIFITCIILSITFGMTYSYRMFLYPKSIAYRSQSPSTAQRVIAMTWFALPASLSFLISWLSFSYCVFILLLTLYLGWAHGYRVMLMPSNINGILKSAVLGLIGSSFVVTTVLFVFMSTVFMLEPSTKSAVESIVAFFVTFAAINIIICIPAMLWTISLNLLSALQYKYYAK